MTDAEKAALAWLEQTASISKGYVPEHARTLKDMLAAPRLPSGIDLEKLKKAVGYYEGEFHGEPRRGTRNWSDEFMVVYEAAKSLLPATKEVWGVSVGLGWVHFDKLEDAMEAATAEARARKHTVRIEPREVPA